MSGIITSFRSISLTLIQNFKQCLGRGANGKRSSLRFWFFWTYWRVVVPKSKNPLWSKRASSLFSHGCRARSIWNWNPPSGSGSTNPCGLSSNVVEIVLTFMLTTEANLVSFCSGLYSTSCMSLPALFPELRGVESYRQKGLPSISESRPLLGRAWGRTWA